MQYTQIFSVMKCNFIRKNDNMLKILAQNIDLGYTLEPPRNQCFGTKIKKIVYPYIKVGFNGYTFHRYFYLMKCYVTFTDAD